MADAGRYGLRYRRQEGQKREEEEGACMGGIAGSNFRLGSYKDANGQLMADRLPFLWS